MARQAGYPSAQFDLARDLVTATATVTAIVTRTPRPTATATASATSTATATATQTAAPTANTAATLLYRMDGKRFIVGADEMLSAFLELQRATHAFAVGLIL
jgi:carbohydrate-binding DOMON domain-containing protein